MSEGTLLREDRESGCVLESEPADLAGYIQLQLKAGLQLLLE